jgi:hypothetical protein
VTEADLTAFLEWLRDWKSLTNRHRAELDDVTERVAARYPAMVGGVASMTAGPGALGTMVPLPDGVVYMPGRNETVLAEARMKYGDTFVDWLAREPLIVETLTGS